MNSSKKITIISAVLLLFVVLLLTILNYLILPSNIRVTNITDKSATVIWETKMKTKSSVYYYKDNTKAGEATDNECTIQGADRAQLHCVTIENLDENTSYSLKVGNGFFYTFSSSKFAETFTNATGNTFKTYTASENPVVPAQVYGKIINSAANNSYATVIIKLPNHSVVSGTCNTSGNWLVELSTARDAQGNLNQLESKYDNVEILIVTDDLVRRSFVQSVTVGEALSNINL